MNTLEDKLRASLWQTAEEIPPHGVPPLRLTSGRRVRGLWRAPHRFLGPWLTPLAAAAAVAAVIFTSVAISGVFHPHRPAAQHAAGKGGVFAGLPAYYVTLYAPKPSEWPHRAIVRATATGAVVATITPPRPFRVLEAATASGNGHDFVLVAATGVVTHSGGGTSLQPGRSRLFLLRVGRGGHPARLTALHIPPLSAKTETSLALSRDGSKLAVALRGGSGGGPGPAIEVFTLTTGAERVWTWPGGPPITSNSGGNGEVLSWTADGRTLAFQQWVGNSIDIRLLDTTTPGGSLPGDSKLGLRWQDAGDPVHFVHGKITNVIFGFSAIITPDGSKIVAATATETRRPLNSELAFTEFAVVTGKVERVLYPWRLPGLYPGQVQDVLWSNPSGSKLIVVAHPPGAKPARAHDSPNSAGYGIELGVVTGKHFTPLPGAPSLRGPGPWPAW